MKTTTIGELIEKEVRKQQIPITAFATKINCNRNNVYNIFKRNTIDILLLKQISQVLNRNFFKELADNMDLANVQSESEASRLNREAVSAFLEFVPDILKKMGRPSSIIFMPEDDSDDFPKPDFGIPDNGLITLTIGNTMRERIGDNEFINVADIYFENYHAEVISICASDKNVVNIPIKQYSESQWQDVFEFVFDEIDNLNLKLIKYNG